MTPPPSVHTERIGTCTRIMKKISQCLLPFALAAFLWLGACNKIPGVAKIPGFKSPAVLRTELTSESKYEEDYGERYEDYKKGYKDGCETGFAGYGIQFYKYFNTWQQDPVLAN